MVQIFALSIVITETPSGKPIIGSLHMEGGQWYSFLYKDTLKEFVVFFSKLMAEKTRPGQRQKIIKDQYYGYTVHRSDGIAAVLIADETYPERVAFDIARNAAYDFNEQCGNDLMLNGDKIKDYYFSKFNEKLKTTVQNYQDPTKGDKILKLRKDIDDTKEVLGQVLDKLLDRGTTIEELIDKADDLSKESKEFYRKSKKTTCCTIL